jgi:hypothetical protein
MRQTPDLLLIESYEVPPLVACNFQLVEGTMHQRKALVDVPLGPCRKTKVRVGCRVQDSEFEDAGCGT